MSSRWSKDNLVTSHPARLYDGPIRELIHQPELEYLVEEVAQKTAATGRAAGFVKKPFHLDDLIRSVELALADD